jgi:putative toxin-antitoxin system antitoxin component (TIGR02293 family)
MDFATVQRLNRVLALARDIWKSDEAARGFLNRPHPLLNRMTPNEMVVLGEAQTVRVEDILGRLKYGTCA